MNNSAITSNEQQNPYYIQWQMFDDDPERVYTIEFEGYSNKNGRYLDDEASLKHLTKDEPSKVYSEDGCLIYYNNDAYYCMSYNKYKVIEFFPRTTSFNGEKIYHFSSFFW